MAAPAGTDHDTGADFLGTFALDAAHEAHEPPEARGLRRDDVRLLVSPGDAAPVHARFDDLPSFLAAGDVVVVNTSATVPAALDAMLDSGEPAVVHVSTELPAGLWLVEVRRPDGGATAPVALAHATTVRTLHGGEIALLRRLPGSRRLWVAALDLAPSPPAHLARHGRPIRYRHVPRDWPLAAYQTVFADEPGSAEMPSAARPFTGQVLARLAARGVAVAPIVLHTGVSSLEGGEAPYPERFAVPAPTAAVVNTTRAHGGHVVAVGTTVVRALETAADDRGTVHPAAGWTELVVSPTRPVRAVDALLTGWHEPEASHLLMLEAVAGRRALERAYREAFAAGYLWHEFGDSHLLLPYAGGR
jgi:S-adenosylmethionine:tRNA ribosyltransferase-isomerase